MANPIPEAVADGTNSAAVDAIRVQTPLGPIAIAERGGRIFRLTWGKELDAFPPTRQTPLLSEAARQIDAYFSGALKTFNVPLELSASDFERSVQEAMLVIPYGETRTYGNIAEELGTYGQPVGRACRANTIPIIVPCHRVLSATGLGGFSGAGGVETKISLLKLEDGFPFLL